jgi:CheY-like chemotaxis protein
MLLKDRRIFIVEDNLQNRVIVEMLLEQQGAKTAFERWGTGTLKRLYEFAPVDIILLDLMFPNKVSGYDVFDEIRAEATFAHIPIVAVSASDPGEAIPKVRKKGFAGFIAKPIDFVLFPQQIAAVIDGKAVWATS